MASFPIPRFYFFAKGIDRFATLYHIWYAVPKYANPIVYRFYAEVHCGFAWNYDCVIYSDILSDISSLEKFRKNWGVLVVYVLKISIISFCRF